MSTVIEKKLNDTISRDLSGLWPGVNLDGFRVARYLLGTVDPSISASAAFQVAYEYESIDGVTQNSSVPHMYLVNCENNEWVCTEEDLDENRYLTSLRPEPR